MTDDPRPLIQRIIDAADARDLDAAISCYLSDGIYDMEPVGLGIREGHTQIREHFNDWWSGYEEYGHEIEQTHDLGAGVVFCVLLQRGRPAGTDAWVQLRYAAIVTVRDGLIERMTNYSDVDDGRAAAERLAQERR